MNRPDVVAPTVHLNGTSGSDLREQLHRAHEVVRLAADALQAAAPNARDYYVQGAAAFPRARDEHYARLRKLGEIKLELEAIAVAVCDQIDRRSA